MAVTVDILRTWRGPRRVMRDMLADGPREDRAIGYLMVACLLIFVAQWPRLSRLAEGVDFAPGQVAPEMDRLVAYEFMSWLMIWPLVFYMLAALAHLIARAIGGRGTWYGARLALFWSLLATSPLALLYGLAAGFAGDGVAADLAGGAWLASFVAIWALCLREAESGCDAA